jgi:hypothetical protein
MPHSTAERHNILMAIGKVNVTGSVMSRIKKEARKRNSRAKPSALAAPMAELRMSAIMCAVGVCEVTVPGRPACFFFLAWCMLDMFISYLQRNKNVFVFISIYGFWVKFMSNYTKR